MAALGAIPVVAGVLCARTPSEGHALRDAVLSLTAEAIAVRESGDVPAEPDFAPRFGRVIPAEDLQRAIVEPAHRDPFVDAYVRWQLTSFPFDLAVMDDARFARLMSRLPGLLENPRADPAMVTLLERADGAGPLSRRDADRLKSTIDELDERTATAERLNAAARGLRDWIEEQLGATGARPRLALLERCAATIDGGWPTREIKTRVTRAFSDAATDATLDDADRAVLAATAERLVGRERRSVKSATFFADGSVKASFATAGVDAADVRAWVERLHGGR